MIRGDLFNGWAELAGDFPPTLNKVNDPTNLKKNESPDAYGVDYASYGYLKTGTVPTGTARTATTKTISSTTYYWYYDRVWRSSTTQLIFGARKYDDVYVPEGFGSLTVDATIVNFMPCFLNDMWIATASGSYILRNAYSIGRRTDPGQFIQELSLATAANGITLDGNPIVCNASGVFMHDGKKVVELTFPIRTTLGSFASVAILADYNKHLIIGTSKFVIDVPNQKLFDYGTSGFRFTSRTLAQPNEKYDPFLVDSFSFAYTMTTSADSTIKWQIKTEDNDWEDQDDIVISAVDGAKSKKVVFLPAPLSAHKLAIRITSLSNNLSIRSINTCVQGLATETPSE